MAKINRRLLLAHAWGDILGMLARLPLSSVRPTDGAMGNHWQLIGQESAYNRVIRTIGHMCQ